MVDVQALTGRHFCLFITVVIACLMLTPALLISFCDKAEVAQTLIAGTGNHSLPKSREDRPSMSGMVLRRVMRMLWLNRACGDGQLGTCVSHSIGLVVYLVNALLQKRFLFASRETSLPHMLFFQDQHNDRILRRTSASHPVTLDQLMPKSSDAVLQVLQKFNTLSSLQSGDHLRCRRC